jgi:hypothetical protein
MAQAQQVSILRSGNGERQWLSTLVDTMERVSLEKAARRREGRVAPCDPLVVSALRLQLSRPASPYPYWHARPTSEFSLRN